MVDSQFRFAVSLYSFSYILSSEEENEEKVARFHRYLKDFKEEANADDIRKKEYKKEIDELLKDE